MYSPSLLKVPLLLVAAYWCHINATSPTPPATNEEKFEKKYGVGDLLAVPVRLMLHSFEILYHTIAFLEVIDLLYNHRYAPLSNILTTPVTPTSFLGLPLPFLLGVVLLGLGTLLRVSCYRTLGRFFTFELALKQEHSLVTIGPYAYVRHPAYAGSLMALTGCVLTHLGPGAWWSAASMWETLLGRAVGGVFAANALYMLFFLVSRTVKEDAVLRAEFKGQWDAWAERTRYRVLPYVY